jgi:hypothetical protein
MAKPFRRFDVEPPADGVLPLKSQIEEDFRKLEELFSELHASDRRLKVIPVLALPTLAVPYELCTREALRALELAEGAALLLEGANYIAAQPVIRSLFETWIAVAYAGFRFHELVVEENNWSRFDEIGMRLLTQRSDQDKTKLIGIGMMLDHVSKHYADGLSGPDGLQGTDEFLKSVYDQMSDGAHPTPWALMPYGGVRPDQLGMTWSRDPSETGLALMSDLKMSLGMVVGAIEFLKSTADEIQKKFRDTQATDQAGLDAAIETLERMLQREPTLAPEALQIFRERAGPLVEALKKRRETGAGAS